MVEEKDRNIKKEPSQRVVTWEEVEKPIGYVRSREKRINSVVSQIANGIRVTIRHRDEKITMAASFSFSLGEGDVLESVKVGTCPCLATVPGELIRADIHEHNITTSPLPFRDLIRLELEPFIIGVGWVKVDYTPEGVVVFRSNIREVLSRHDILINDDWMLQYNRQDQSQ